MKKLIIRIAYVTGFVFFCQWAIAQTVTPPADAGNSKWYDYFPHEDVQMDSTAKVAKLSGTNRYYHAYDISMNKGENIYIKLSSIYKMAMVLHNRTSNTDSVIRSRGNNIGTTILTYYEAPDSGDYDLFAINLDNDNKDWITYSLYLLTDRLYANTNVEPSLCDKLQLLADYQKLDYWPLNTGKLLSSSDSKLFGYKSYESNMELMPGVLLDYMVSTTPTILSGNIDSSAQLSGLTAKMAELKNKIAACYAGNANFKVKESKQEYNENLPDIEFAIKKSTYIDEQLFRLHIDHNKDKGLYYLVFTAQNGL